MKYFIQLFQLISVGPDYRKGKQDGCPDLPLAKGASKVKSQVSFKINKIVAIKTSWGDP